MLFHRQGDSAVAVRSPKKQGIVAYVIAYGSIPPRRQRELLHHPVPDVQLPYIAV